MNTIDLIANSFLQLNGGMGTDERVTIGLVSLIPSTGDLVYDEFQGEFVSQTFSRAIANFC